MGDVGSRYDMLTQLERIDDRGVVDDIRSPRGFVANGATSVSLYDRPSTALSAWRSPGFYIGVILMALILAATQVVRLAMALRGRLSA